MQLVRKLWEKKAGRRGNIISHRMAVFGHIM